MLGEKKERDQRKIKPCKCTEKNQSEKDLWTTLHFSACLCTVWHVITTKKKYFRGLDHIPSSELRRKYFSLQKIWKLSKFRLWQVWPCFHSICFLHHANQWSMKQNVMFSYITQYNAVSRQNAQNTFSYISHQKIHYLFIQK